MKIKLVSTILIKPPIITMIISVLMFAAYVLFGSAPEALIWFSASERQSLPLFSTHFIHNDFQHLLWNVVAFAVFGGVVETYSKRDLFFVLLTGVLAVNLYLVCGYSLDCYIGMSGVLHTVFVVALFQLSQKSAYRSMAIWGLVISMMNIVYEIYSGSSFVSPMFGHTEPQAHLVGWLMGFIYVFIKTINYFGGNKYKLYRRVLNV